MKRVIVVSLLLWSQVSAQDEGRPFVTYPETTKAYLKRIQEGGQAHAFAKAKDFAAWQKEARAALRNLIGLQQMERELAGFEPTVTLAETAPVKRGPKGYFRWKCSIETEPGITVPFYVLAPLDAKPNRTTPLLICPHGHDRKGWHSYAGVFQDENHRKEILGRDGNIAEQAVLRGFIAIAPATRGLAAEVLVPDPKGRHGNRPCRAQLMHCLVAGRTPIGERVWDMQRILDWAMTTELVDRNRVVMTGNSGGGVLTAYMAALDERIRVAIPSCSFTSATSSEGFLFHCDCCMVPGLRNWGDWAEIGGLVAPRHLLLVHGVSDGLHKRADVEKVAGAVGAIFKTAGVPGNFSLKWGQGGHRFYPDLMWPFITAGLE